MGKVSNDEHWANLSKPNTVYCVEIGQGYGVDDLVYTTVLHFIDSFIKYTWLAADVYLTDVLPKTAIRPSMTTEQ